MAKIDHVPLETAAKQAAQLSRQLKKAAKLAQTGTNDATRKELVKASALVNVLVLRERAWGSK